MVVAAEVVVVVVVVVVFPPSLNQYLRPTHPLALSALALSFARSPSGALESPARELSLEPGAVVQGRALG